MHPLRRCVTVMLLLAVTLIALLGMSSARASTATWDPCQDTPAAACVVHSESAATSEGYPVPQHDPCLHDHACGGGAALGLGGLLLAVVAASAAPTPTLRSTRRRPAATTVLATALLVGGIEHPPRFVH